MIPTCGERRLRGWSFALVLALVAQTLPLVAMAESPADQETAKAALLAGRDKLAKNDLTGARDQFRAAWALIRSPRNGVELAETHEKLGELVEARVVYVEVTKLPPRDGESKESLEARSRADARAAELQTLIPTITIRLDNAPKGAEPSVTVDDASVPLAALAAPRRLNPGKHVVVVRMAGVAPKKSTFELVEKQARVVVVDLAVEGDGANASSSVEPKVETTPAPPASTKPEPPPSSAGREAPRPSGASALTWIGFGVGGVGLLVGGVTGALAAGKAATVKDNCPNQVCPPAYHEDLNSAKSLSSVSTIGFAVGVIGLGVGVWGLVSGTSAEPEKTTSSRVRPWIGLGTAGLLGEF